MSSVPKKHNHNFVSSGVYYFAKQGLKHMVVISGTFDIDQMNDLYGFVQREIDQYKKTEYYGWRHG